MPLLEDAKEEQSYPIKIEIRIQETGELADDSDVSAVSWTLQDAEGNIINSREDVAGSAVASQTITLTGDDLAMVDQTKRKELRVFTAIATVDSNPWANEDKFYIQNMLKVT